MTESVMEIAALLEAHAAGDSSAFERLWELYRRDLWAFLLNHVRARQDAEDLFQEIGMKVFRNMDGVREPARFRSWLFAVAMNAVRSHHRGRKDWQADEREENELAHTHEVSAANPEEHVAQRERLQLLQQCLRALPERDREVLLLGTMAGLPGQDIADRLALNLNTVKTILRRAKIKLARMMAEAEYGG